MFLLALLLTCMHIGLYADPVNIKILQEDDLKNLKVIESDIKHTGKNSAVSIISDGQQKYILKQVKLNKFEAQLNLIKEIIVSSIGCAHGIHVDQAWFIPCNVGADLKIYKNRAATLHTFIDGSALNENALPTCLPKNFRLSQRFRPYVYEYKHGFEISYGFNEITIKSMSCHKDLPPITALDTLFGNFDRDTDNIFYDKNSDNFYGIDQGASFSGEIYFLPIFAYHQILKLKSVGFFTQCSQEIIKSLQLYKDYLKLLCTVYQPTDIIAAFEKLTPLLQPSKQQNEKNDYIEFLKFYVQESYRICLDIVHLLEPIL